MAIKILIVDDEEDIRDVLRITLEGDGYEIIEAENGEEGLKAIHSRAPDLVLLDYKMPKMTGLEVCAKIKQDLLLQHLPVIMVTGKGELGDKVDGINAGADDYVVKPFEPKELLARIRMILRRTTRDLEANPLTRLPGNVSIMHEFLRRIESKGLFAVCYIDLDKFKAYNDTYGFEHGDEVIRETARIIIRVAQECGNPDDFIGHIGGDDFILVTELEKAEKIANRLIELFDQTAPSFYNETDRMRGYIVAHDRQGIERHFPILSISIGIVTNEFRKLDHVAQIGEIGAELKGFAKNVGKSNFIIDKRK